ncbi:Hypothetical predicted protein [Paramuricea clavata]|uniref:Uncharacterized protein n=1 Tax=Paramuricea clavata TaxID=317549 RepID=A0A6S7HBJ9_PARCT|nr:Hypothetical predicted protein [Paramuricea clavata]
MKDPAIILAKLQDRFVPVRNILHERYIFHNTEQQVHETIDQFLIKLRQLAESCNFGTLEDEMVRDRPILGCRDSAARTRLFREKITLKKSIESLCISETTSGQLKEIKREDNQEPVNYAQREDAKKRNVPKSVDRQRRERAGANSSKKQGVNLMNKESDDEYAFYVETVDAIRHAERKSYFVSLSLWDKDGGESQIQCHLDTGATCNVMSCPSIPYVKSSRVEAQSCSQLTPN